ncbi:PDR/VanB family oxidoreductase [Streptomyces sp. NPDC101393]|uniref:PDR/VanB family oxidoreductase n=1 Tax=Streptomyces sp. NPDC101393 TaxID=3366141 RepID=UPI0037F8CABB
MTEPALDLLVHRMTWEADDVLALDLVHPDGKALPPWEPGAHIDVHTGGHIRQYSLCGDPDDTGRYRIAVLHTPTSRGGSAHIHTTLRPGTTVHVRGPRNHFALEPAGRYLFLAGGIGITPLLAMARHAHRTGTPWQMVYGGRRRTSLAFTGELADLTAHTTDRCDLHPQDVHGHLDLDAALTGLTDDTLVYCCGPEPLLAAVEERCAALGRTDRLRTERFAAPRPAAPEGGGGHAFDVVCARAGRTVRVEDTTTILDAVEAAGLAVTSSCRDGICGTCETRVLDGTPDHRDFLLSDSERAANTSLMICVSRCAGDRLVLDL